MPSVTLPCHISLFHSVDPSRHGTTTNTYAPQVRPITGLFEALHAAGKHSSMVYNWEELRDCSRPANLDRSYYVDGYTLGYEPTTTECYDFAVKRLKEDNLDFMFLYFGWPDGAGHSEGWMSDEYIRSLNECNNLVMELIEQFKDEYEIIYTADHGGHDRTHGTDLPEDMTIPILCLGKSFAAGKKLEGLTIKDIAPTIASILGVNIPAEWEGKIIK